jgi:Icc-related predicted phosphoesterase
MIKIAYGSDFHFERYPVDTNLSFINSWKFEPYTTHIVIAGDMHVGVYNVIMVLDFIWDIHKIPIIYVPGNHEYYQNSFVSFDHDLYQYKKDGHYNVLLREYCINENVLFVGAQGVSDGSYEEIPGLPIKESNYADFWMTTDFKETYKIYGAEDRRYIKSILSGTSCEHKVVVTHNPPHPYCIDEKYKRDVNNGMFVNDYSDILIDNTPDIWICGHTHSKFKKEVNKTLILCNPYGYEFESSSKQWEWEYAYIN